MKLCKDCKHHKLRAPCVCVCWPHFMGTNNERTTNNYDRRKRAAYPGRAKNTNAAGDKTTADRTRSNLDTMPLWSNW